MKKYFQIYTELKKRYMSTSMRVKNWRLWALRRVFSKYFIFPCWVNLESGAKIWLGSDMIDDLILEDIVGRFEKLYFPEEFEYKKDQNFVIFDIGAHHGIYSVEALSRYPHAQIISVEPVAKSIIFLKKNLRANKLLHRARIVEGGIGVEDGWAYVEHPTTGSWSDKTVEDAQNGGERVNIFSLKTALNGAIPTLVKCNAEGAEFTLFPQMFSMNIRPDFVVLMAHPECGSVDDLLDLFKANGYLVYDSGSTPKRIRLHCVLNQ